MGKIRIKQIGAPELEEAQKEQAKKRKEAKRAKKEKKKTRAPGLKGGERVVVVGPTEEELAAMEAPKTPEPSLTEEHSKASKPSPFKPPKSRSKRYKKAAQVIDKEKSYSIKEAIKILRKVSLSRFNGTVEVHLVVKEKGLSGQISLPHGTGKKIRVAIADDKLLTQIEIGKVDFDVLVAHPKMMPKLAKYGKVLGPKGLMPNPKAGTVTDEPEKKAQELNKGQIHFKTEREAPLIHLVIGKMDFTDKQLIENFERLIQTIGPTKIKKVTLKSTISPGIKINLE